MKHMRKMKLLRNILLTFWFGWFALAGVLLAGIIIWITPLSLSFYKILMVGSMLGILTGGLAALFIFFLLWRRYGVVVAKGYFTYKMITEKINKT